VVATRIFQRGINHILAERPFQGGPGARLYVAAGEPTDIIYRPARAFDPKRLPLLPVLTRDLAVATCLEPDTELSYVLPPELIGVPISCQVRTFADDYENDTIYRPRTVSSDDDGEDNTAILGTAVVVSVTKLDGGGMRLQFTYTVSRNGRMPDYFSVVKASGPGTVPITQVDYFDRDYSVDVSGLVDAEDYTFDLIGHSGAVDTTLIAAIAFTADTMGPDAVTSLIAEEY
jgi:hypothetical protein